MVMSGSERDDSLFTGTAAYYARGRLPYSPDLVPLLTDVLGLDGRGRLLDVGCGPGTLALALAGSFAEVVGIDPDPEMLAEAAARQSVNARWIRARAEQLPLGLGTFEVATFGQSFHWTDRDLVAAKVRAMLAPGGAFVHVAHLGGRPFPAPTDAPIAELVARYLGPGRRAGRGTSPPGTPGNEESVLARAGFVGPERHVLSGGREFPRTEDDLVAEVFSMSFSAPPLFGGRLGAFEAELRALLREISPTGRFVTRQPTTEVRVWRS
ncbi:MAG TPA: methyltransferase domain-containing protein [Actinospica sp.]|nr:methyltransferase domain-containing protein [Actinospica sp.]